jgi:hypothetical protein
MSDQTNNAGGTPSSPAGTPGGNTAGDTGGSFVRTRSQQLAQSMGQQEPGAEPADRQQQQQQQSPPGERMIRVGNADIAERAITDALAFQAEQNVRKNTLPKTEAEFVARNSENFQLPEGVKFQFDEKDPLLAQARKLALARGLDQETFSALLDLHVASKVGELQNQARARAINLEQLGAAGPQRIDAIAMWLNARAGKDGAAVASFIKQYPSAPLVRALESVIRQMSSQGGADYSPQGRAEQEDAGKIPGYENMSFVEKRAHQMAQMLNRPGYRGGGLAARRMTRSTT